MRFPALIAACLVLLAGCGSAPDTRPVFTVSNWGGAGDDSDYDKLVNGMITQFGRDNDCIARAEGVPDEYVSKMILNHVANAMPDVMTLDASSAAIFINNGVLEDLTPLIEKDRSFDIGNYWPNAVGVARRGSKIYAIPGDFTPMVVYYNKKLFDEAGVPYPKPGWNFNDFLETARKLTVPAKKQYGFYFNNWMAGWIMWLWNNGGDALSPDGKRAEGFLDSSQNVKTIAFLKSLMNQYKVAPALSQTAAMGVDPFANGQCAMAVSGHWSIVAYKAAPKGQDGKPKLDWTQLGVVELPHNTPKSNTVMYEAGFGIPVKAKHKDLAWKYIKLWTSHDTQLRYNKSGIAVDGRRDVALERADSEIEKEFLKIVPTARPPYGSWIEGYDVVQTFGENALDSVLNNDKDIYQALHEAAKMIDLEFAKK